MPSAVVSPENRVDSGDFSLKLVLNLNTDFLVIHVKKSKKCAPMNHRARGVKRFLKSEDGPAAVEYAVMLALIVVVCLTAIEAVGNNAKTMFTAVKTALT